MTIVVRGADSPPEAKKVLIYRLGSLGDAVVSLPCFHLIRARYPAAERWLLTNVPVSSKAAPMMSLLEPPGLVHGSIAYPLKLRDPISLFQLVLEIRRHRFDHFIYLAANRGGVKFYRDRAFFHLCGLPSPEGAPRSRADRLWRSDEVTGDLEREATRLARSLSCLGSINLSDQRSWDLELSEEENRVAASLIGDAGANLLAINTGGKEPAKDWGEANWEELLSRLKETRLWTGVAIIGAGDDSPRAERLCAIWGLGAISLAGRLRPRESAAVIHRASLFIGHDSGPLHLAAAVGTPTLGLFGGFNKPRVWHPYGEHVRVLHQMKGMQEISVGCVVEAALNLVEKV